MPLYTCSITQGSLSPDTKEKIANHITRIHCELTAAPSTFVHVFFFDADEPMSQIAAGGAGFQLFGNIRAGRTDEVKQELVRQVRSCVAEKAGVDLADVEMVVADMPAQWVMEGGDVLPEPGEEAAWIEAHSAKLDAAST